METQVKKWGNSLGLRIPKVLARQLEINDGSTVNININNNKLEIIPLQKNNYNLSEMLANINKHNIHNEIETGEPAGNEIW